MGVLRTNEDSFEDQANLNNYVTDQHFEFTIASRGINSWYQILPKNYYTSQVIEDSVVATLNSDDTENGIIQVFQVNVSDNLNGMKVLAKASHPVTDEVILIDDFEYSSHEDARTAWPIIQDDLDEELAIYSDNYHELNGNYCMKITAQSDAEGSSFYKAFDTPQDWEQMKSLYFNWRATKEGSGYRWRIRIYDNIDQIAYTEFSPTDKYNWEYIEFAKDIFNNTGVIDWSQIVKIDFYCVASDCWHENYIDDLGMVKNTITSKVTSEVSLIHFGTNPDFSTIGDIKTLDNNFDVEDLIVSVNGAHIVDINLQYGASSNDWKLVDGDYYGIYIKKPEVGTITLYGSDTQTFDSGNLYSNNGGTLTAMNKSLAFMLFTFSKSTLKKINFRQDVWSKHSNIDLMLINPANFKVKQILGTYTFSACELIEVSFDYSNPEIIIVDHDAHLYVYYQDDKNSNSTELNVCPRFHYEELGE